MTVTHPRLPAKPDGPIALDTETSGLFVDDGARVAVVSIAWFQNGEVRGAALPFDQGPTEGKLSEPSLFYPDYNLNGSEWYELCEWLQDQRIVMHNAKFDLHMMRVGTRHWPGVDLQDQVVWDTQLANRVLDPEHLTGLKPTAERFGLGGGEDERKAEEQIRKAAKVAARGTGDPIRYDLVDDWELVSRYARLDAEFTLRLARLQWRRLAEGEGSWYLCHRELEIAKTLYRMECRGIGFDREQSYAIATRLERRLTEIAESLPFEPNVNAAKRYWFEEPVRDGEPRLMPYSMTPTGKPQLSKDVLRRMVDDGVAHAAEWQEYSKIDKMISMWYEGWADMCGADGRLRTSFNQARRSESDQQQAGAVSGRFSVERVQLQAIPHEYQLVGDVPGVRTLFRAKDGHELWEIDLSQAEVRVASSISNCTAMIEGIRAGEDSHSIATRRTFGIEPDHYEWEFYRQVGKRLNFAMLYGAGVQKIREQIELFTGRIVGMAQVERWVTDYRSTFPQFPRHSRRISQQVERERRLRLVSGMVRAFEPDEPTHKAFNAQIQGGVAEAMKDWMLWVEKNYPDTMLLQIHDSLILELPIEGGDRMAKEISDGGCRIFEELFPGVPFESDAKRWADKS